jgi:hypothetical protein
LSAPEREVTSPSDFKVVGALVQAILVSDWQILKIFSSETAWPN